MTTRSDVREAIVDWLRRYLQRQHAASWAGDCTALADFGIDSLAVVDLACNLEQWLGVPVSSTLLADVRDTDGLVECIRALQTGSASPTAAASPYETFVNPHLAGKLRQLRLDRTFVRGEGAWLYDSEGRRCLDFMAQYGALPFGHHPQDVWRAMQALREDGEPVFAQPSIPRSAGRLAERLIELAPPGLRYATFCNSGAEAVEAALKMARHATGRMAVLAARRGFHGKTFAALSATGNPAYQAPFGLPLPGFDRVDFGDLGALEAQLSAHPGRYAAFIVETIQGEGGVHVAPPGYLHSAREACHRHGALLIVDEVQTGLGRTGVMFSCDAEGVRPDIVTLAKALGGGLVPIGAVLCTEAAYSEAFALKHSSTFAGNALAARAGLATLDLLTRDGGALLQHVQAEGALLRASLERIRARHPWLVRDVRGRGFMLGLEFTNDRASWPENFLGIAAEAEELAQFVASHLLNVEGVRLAPTLNGGNVLRIQPPLNATREQCSVAADALGRTIDRLASRSTGAFYRSILRGQAPAGAAVEPARVSSKRAAGPSAAAGDASSARFAFLVHPLDEHGYAEFDASLASLDAHELREFAQSMSGLLDPVVGTAVQIASPTGALAAGDFILIGHTAAQLKDMPVSDALKMLNKGIDLARARGASLVGLGAYTSVVSGGGAHLVRDGIGLTSGNSYTVVSALDALDLALAQAGACWSEKSAGVVGAAGAIGSCVAVLLAERAPRLVLIGNPAHAPAAGRERLLSVARRIVRHALAGPADDRRPGSLASGLAALACDVEPDVDALVLAMERRGQLILAGGVQGVALADVVVTATSFPGQSLDDDLLPRGALVCDISRPRSIGESIVHRRPDVRVIDGGLVALPGGTRIGPYGLRDGTSYACMAETMLLALERDYRNTSLGNTLDVQEVKRQRALAVRHGFAVAGLQSFGRPLVIGAPGAPAPARGLAPIPRAARSVAS